MPVRNPVHWIDYTVVAAYFAVVLTVGIWFASRGPMSLKGYYRGENSISPSAAGLSLMATRLSVVTFISIPAKAYSTNWTYVLLPFSNIAVAFVVTRWILPFYCQLDLTSIYEYLERRFDRSIRLLGSFSFLGLETARLGVLILVPALVVTVVTDANVYLCILAVGVVTTVSTAIGGIKAVIWVDVFQAVLKLAGVLICIGVIVARLDHPLAALAAAIHAGKLKLVEPSFDLSKPSLVIIALYWIGEIKNYVANQTNAQRFMVTRDVAAAQRSVWIAAISMVAMIVLCLAMGTALHLFYREFPARLNPAMKNADELVPYFILHEMPVGLAGLLLAVVFSASMAALNSALNSISAVVVTDLYRPLFPEREDRTCVRFGKGVIWIAGGLATVVGVLMARQRVDSLFDRLMEILGLFGGGLGGIFVLGIFTTRAHSRGAWLGFAGSCVVLFVVKTFTTVHLLAYMAVGLLSCFGFGYVCSLLWPSVEKDLRGLTVHTAVGRAGTSVPE